MRTTVTSSAYPQRVTDVSRLYLLTNPYRSVSLSSIRARSAQLADIVAAVGHNEVEHDHPGDYRGSDE